MAENRINKPAPNIDDAEIAKFEAMASLWWDKKGIDIPRGINANTIRTD